MPGLSLKIPCDIRASGVEALVREEGDDAVVRTLSTPLGVFWRTMIWEGSVTASGTPSSSESTFQIASGVQRSPMS